MIQIRFHHFDTVESTNNTALELARAGEPEGTVVIAGSQTGGKGRRGRIWWDRPGESVLMSAILIPPIPMNELPRLSFVASLAVSDLLQTQCGLDALLKWPNDVLVHDKKIAGILVETTPAPDGIAAIVGIGVNVNQTKFPPEIANTATSIALEIGTRLDVADLAAKLANALFANYEKFLARGFEEIRASWENYMWGRGKEVEVESEGCAVRAVIDGIDPTGALILRNAHGSEHLIRAADEIRFPDSEIRP